MIQLSSPQPENFPVNTGKSPEKAAISYPMGDGRFEKALEQSRLNKRNEQRSETADSESKKVSLKSEDGSGAARKSESATRKSARSESGAAAEQNGENRSAGKSVQTADTGDKNLKSGENLLSLTKQKSKITFGKSSETKLVLASKSGTKSSDQAAEIASALKLSVETVSDKSEKTSVLTDVDSSLADQSIANGLVEGAELSAGADGESEVLNGNTVLAAAVDKDSAGTLKASLQSGKKTAVRLKTDDSMKITVEDRRTAALKDEGVVLKKVEHNSESGSLTLEMAGTEEELPGMMLRSDDGSSSAAKFSLQTAEESKGAALLDRQLKNEGTAELTKNIRFVLKDNNEGEIKLILKPEALGKVRINLNLNENNIVGKIIVENNSVRQVFMNNLADLTRALEDSGFDSAALDVSVGGGQSEGRGAYREERPVYFTDNALDELEGMIPVVYDEGHSLSQINLVV